jgi:hypothetical protein
MDEIAKDVTDEVARKVLEAMLRAAQKKREEQPPILKAAATPPGAGRPPWRLEDIPQEVHDEIARKHIEACLRAAREGRCEPPRLRASRTVHYTELRPISPSQPLGTEWNTYCREVGRLIAEGREGKFVLIGGETILGVFDTWSAARRAGMDRFGVTASFFVHEVLTQEPVLLVRG